MLHHVVRTQTRRSLLRPTRTCRRWIATEYTVTLDNQTLYIPQEVAEALGWKKEQGHHVTKLSLCGVQPEYFTITLTGSESGMIRSSRLRVSPTLTCIIELFARATVESFGQDNVKTVLEKLKRSDQQ